MLTFHLNPTVLAVSSTVDSTNGSMHKGVTSGCLHVNAAMCCLFSVDTVMTMCKFVFGLWSDENFLCSVRILYTALRVIHSWSGRMHVFVQLTVTATVLMFCQKNSTVDQWYFSPPLWPFHHYLLIFMHLYKMTLYREERESFWARHCPCFDDGTDIVKLFE